jgi:hypothetical protein
VNLDNKLPVIVVLSVGLIRGIYAQEIVPSIKGHSLGESVTQFVSKLDGDSQQRFAACNATVIASMAMARATDKKERKALAEQATPSLECRTFLSTAFADGEGTKESPTVIKSNDSTNPLYHLTGNIIGGGLLRFEGVAEFEEGYLVSWGVPVGPWDAGWAGAKEKFGQPSSTDVQGVQNGFGATWSVHSAVWEKPNYVVRLYEPTSFEDHTNAWVGIETHIHYISRQPTTHKNALD